MADQPASTPPIAPAPAVESAQQVQPQSAQASDQNAKPFYQHHVFFCINERAPGERVSCARSGSEEALSHAKKRIKKLGLAGDGKVRINRAGCLERCEEGPVVVIYPQGTWYTYVDKEDIDDIIDTHIVGGQIVERLKI